uniref:HECT-type E3 ubiquitin transferase n=1 Tax=Phallusia mammillata TaxID=59560 RepID=A0A6F9DEY1_9ASCI|nr:E3 ubiquitin-protein ligase HACE1-like [Phallusia mammillata]
MDVRNVKQHFSVQFKDEEGMGDGVMREWLSLLSSEIMNPQYGLFSPSADGCSFQPNRHSAINPDHLVYFKFAGKILGLALYRGQFVNVTFTSSFYKHLLGIKVNYMDVESIDPEYAKNLQWILDNDITDLGLELSFVVETDVFGVMQELELKKNGSKILVTQENKEEYVQLVTELRMTRAIQPQIDAFKEGFNEFIPESLLQIFDVDELKTMLSGSSKLDVEYLKSLTSYSGCYDENHQVIKWLWQCVENMDDEEQTSLLLFVTGCSRLPPPFLTHHNTKFVVSHEPGSEEKLPTASTCMNMLKLPEYGSYETLQQKLFIAVKCGHAGYSFI